MPGRLRTAFRSGNLAEDLGVLLLKGIAAVADVPRTEDVGIDAVCTILRRDRDGNCYAEDEFLVQLKSESETMLRYRDHQLSWFLGQSQPMFIGLVSKANASLSLYPTVLANQALFALPGAKEITMYCREPGDSKWARQANDSVAVWLGPPLLRWTLKETEDAEWLTMAYDALKRFLAIARREYELLSIGQFYELTWATNNKDSIQSVGSVAVSNPEKFPRLAVGCLPSLRSLLLHAITLPEERGNALITTLLGVLLSLRDLGVDIDPATTWSAAVAALKQTRRPRG